jgi:hypothetical protein
VDRVLERIANSEPLPHRFGGLNGAPGAPIRAGKSGTLSLSDTLLIAVAQAQRSLLSFQFAICAMDLVAKTGVLRCASMYNWLCYWFE